MKHRQVKKKNKTTTPKQNRKLSPIINNNNDSTWSYIIILLEGTDYNYKLSDIMITFQFIIEPQKKKWGTQTETWSHCDADWLDRDYLPTP